MLAKVKLRIIPKDLFSARLSALKNHKDVCTEVLCNICQFFNKVAAYKFNPGDYSRYVEKQEIQHPLKPMKTEKSMPKVRFDIQSIRCSDNPFVGITINFATIEKSCCFNVSFREAGLIKTE